MTTFAEDPSSSLTADGLLALAYLDGDAEGFTALYKRYHDDIRRFISATIRDRALAEDLAQETMTRALRYLHKFDPRQPFWPWLRKIAQNVVKAELSRRAAEVPADLPERTLTLPDAAADVDLRDAVAESLRLLPKRQQRALLLRYVEDRDPNDIAALFGLSRNALEQLLSRGRNNFRHEYRARNSGFGFPLAGWVAARLRRVVAAFEARVQAATSATFSVASEVAIGAALTFGGIGVAALGRAVVGMDTPDARVGARPPHVATLAVTEGRGAGSLPSATQPRAAAVPPLPLAHGATVTTSSARETQRVWQDPGHRVVVPPGGSQPTEPASTPPPSAPPTVPADAPATPGATPGDGAPDPARAQPEPTHDPAVQPPVAEPTGTPTPNPTPTQTPAPPAPPQVTNAPMVRSESFVEAPLPEPTASVDDEQAHVVVHEDDVSDASTETTVRKDPTDQGEAINQEVKAEAAGLSVSPKIYLTNSDDDGVLCQVSPSTCLM